MSNVDLNLLLVFDAVMAERNVRRAAERLNRSQPAISQSIARLRDIFADELFRRTPFGVDPTPRAEAVWADIREPLQHLRARVSPNGFEPRHAESEVQIGMSDDIHLLAFPSFVASVRAKAPKLVLRATAIDHQSVWPAVRSGLVDVAVTVAAQPPRGLASKVVGYQTFAIVRRSDMAPPLTLDDYLSRDHVAISFSEGLPGYTEQRLEALGKTRRIIATTPQFAAILDLVISTGAIATMPRSIASLYSRFGAVSLSDCPFEVPQVPILLGWHLRKHSDPLNAWIRDQIHMSVSNIIEAPNLRAF